MDRHHGPDDAPRPATLGELLAVAGDRLAARHRPAYSWAAGLAPVLRRAAHLSESWGQRFERHESGGSAPPADRRQGPARGPRAPFASRPAEQPPRVAPTSASAPPDVPSGPPPPPERNLPVDVREALRVVAGPGAAVMRVRVGAEADAVARDHRADAVTVGTDVRVRAARYRPDTADGFALLAHEASHVTAALSREGPHRRATAGGTDAEERHARQVEQLARRSYGRGPVAGPTPRAMPVTVRSSAAPQTPPMAPAGSPPRAPAGSPPSPAPAGFAVPMRADADRAETAASPGIDVDALRRSLIDDVMRRVRSDFERGG